jgi:dolichyl-phosphate-mannose--protein O-mannosyl transferase
MVGNPLLGLSTTIALLTVTATFISSEARGDVGRLGVLGRRSLPLLVAYAALILPWMLSNRDSYMNHYLPPYGFGLVLLAGVLAEIGARRRPPVVAFVALAFATSVFYARVWTAGIMPVRELHFRLPFRKWR